MPRRRPDPAPTTYDPATLDILPTAAARYLPTYPYRADASRPQETTMTRPRRPDITGAQHVGTDQETGQPVYRARYKQYSNAPIDYCDSCLDAEIMMIATHRREIYALCDECTALYDP